jgi:glycosyltransferase involved in cell wall biosynthesis
MRPLLIPGYIRDYLSTGKDNPFTLQLINDAYRKNLLKNTPLVSIIIPAFNEQENIIPALMSLCNNQTEKSVEIIVIDNNSIDNTASIVKRCGVVCISEPKQGITNARNAGLLTAAGTYILNADADTIYPKNWIDEMTNPLINNDRLAITYGKFSFIPIADTGRIVYYFYEILADITRLYNNYKKTEAVNVYGFNSCFRRKQGAMVDGFNHPPGTNEDGYLALKLLNGGFGSIHRINTSSAIVWTTDRRIQIDGGLWRAVIKRLKRIMNIGNDSC